MAVKGLSGAGWGWLAPPEQAPSKAMLTPAASKRPPLSSLLTRLQDHALSDIIDRPLWSLRQVLPV